MSLLVPLGLLALLSLPLIVVLHLIRERRRRVVVPALLLWQHLPRRHDALSRRHLKLTLLLVLHLLAAFFLALALAQPQWLSDLFGRPQHLVVIVDTSASMAAPAGSGSRLDAARARLRTLAAGLNGQATLTLISAGPEARLVDRAGPAGVSRLLAAAEALQPAGVGSDLATALTLAASDLQHRPAGQVVVLTDAALPALDTELRNAPTHLALRWEPIGTELPNRAILTLAARPQNQGGMVQIYLRAANYSHARQRSNVRLFADDRLLDTRSLDFPPQAEVEQVWTIPPGVRGVRAELDGNDDLPADDVAYLSLVSRPLRTRLVSANPALLERALRAMPGLEVQVISPGAFVEVTEADLTILDGFLPNQWPAGAVLVLNPPTGSPLLDVEPAQRVEAGPIMVQARPDLFAGLSLGGVVVETMAPITPPLWAEVLLSYAEQPLILRGQVAQSDVAIWNMDLAQTNLTTRLAFPLLLARTLRDLAPADLPASILAGQRLTLRPDLRSDLIEIRDPHGILHRIPVESAIHPILNLDHPGLYEVRELAGEREIFRGILAVNSGAARESNLAPQALPAARNAPAVAASLRRDPQLLWPWLVGLGLAVVLGEWIYVHARR
ncbi:vWA domain-containing protein [Candidatus Oscillochloris fontis]|uniref:vWA domain-containing protein n=1 Tax=Candidatus Oscillochloris fontis TaxID=2496868 RepID=UPI00101D22B3|nr:VWA domain-containing protein [Candidatus Oscillochloris fontis]